MRTLEARPISSIEVKTEVVDPWTQLFDDAIAAEAAHREGQDASMYINPIDVLEIPTLFQFPDQLPGTQPVLYYFNLGKNVGSHIQSRPERDELTREAARYAARLYKATVHDYIFETLDREEKERRKQLLQQHLSFFAVGLGTGIASSTEYSEISSIETHTDGSETIIYRTIPITWRGRTTRDRIVQDFNRYIVDRL